MEQLVRSTACSEVHCDARESEILDELQTLSAMASTTQVPLESAEQELAKAN